MAADPDTFSPNVMTAICSLVIVGSQALSRYLGNKKVEKEANKVNAETASPGSVERVDTKVEFMQSEIETLRNEVAAFKAQNAVQIGKVLERSDSIDRSVSNIKRNNERLLTRAGIAWEDDVTIVPASTTTPTTPKEK